MFCSFRVTSMFMYLLLLASCCATCSISSGFVNSPSKLLSACFALARLDLQGRCLISGWMWQYLQELPFSQPGLAKKRHGWHLPSAWSSAPTDHSPTGASREPSPSEGARLPDLAGVPLPLSSLACPASLVCMLLPPLALCALLRLCERLWVGSELALLPAAEEASSSSRTSRKVFFTTSASVHFRSSFRPGPPDVPLMTDPDRLPELLSGPNWSLLRRCPLRPGECESSSSS
mmetsp:Transcript_62489/g.177468  ORF Transcript_62489/g.177468 Transcript_62489/m.177468 type:complete len:233 (-) Transcript_62489:156-854(-)